MDECNHARAVETAHALDDGDTKTASERLIACTNNGNTDQRNAFLVDVSNEKTAGKGAVLTLSPHYSFGKFSIWDFEIRK